MIDVINIIHSLILLSNSKSKSDLSGYEIYESIIHYTNQNNCEILFDRDDMQKVNKKVFSSFKKYHFQI